MAERGRSERVVASVTTAAVVPVLEVVVAVSFAALIFGGSLAGRVADGIGLYIAGAALSFVKIAQLATTNEFEVVLTAVPPAVLARFERAGVRGDGASVHVEVDLDRGLERCEEALLRAGPAPTHDLWAAGDATALRRRLEPYLERLELEAGQILIRQGDPPDDVFVLESGRLSVVMRSADGGRMRLRTMRPGIVVGEISLYTAERRTADVVAEAPSTVLRLGRDTLERIERDEPGLAAAVHRWFAAVLAERLGYSLRALDAQGD